jgi:hypothetical protein
MQSYKRVLAILVVAAVAFGVAVATGVAGGNAVKARAGKVQRFSLAGYKLETSYDKGRNTGNTFQQTYAAGTVHAVPVKGPYVGQKFPSMDYVALPVTHDMIFVSWQDSKTHALTDVFVMNLATHTVLDYAPGSTAPESTGTVKVLKQGTHPIP